jgi:hypothetical protein
LCCGQPSSTLLFTIHESSHSSLRSNQFRILQTSAASPKPKQPENNEFDDGPAKKVGKNGKKINDYQFPKTAQHILESGMSVIIVVAVIGSFLIGAAVCS